MAHTPANSYKTNPVIIEVFTGDLDLSNLINGTPHSSVHVSKVVFHSAAAGDVFALQDKEGTTAKVVFTIGQNVNGGTTTVDFGEKGFIFPELYFDTSEVNSGLGAGDRVTIYLQ